MSTEDSPPFVIFLTPEGAKAMRHLDAFLRVTTAGQLVLDCQVFDADGALVRAVALPQSQAAQAAAATVELFFPHRYVALVVRAREKAPPGFATGKP